MFTVSEDSLATFLHLPAWSYISKMLPATPSGSLFIGVIDFYERDVAHSSVMVYWVGQMEELLVESTTVAASVLLQIQVESLAKKHKLYDMIQEIQNSEVGFRSKTFSV